jgi:hypothetical protein
VLRESFPINFRENKSLRRLIVKIERREPSAQHRSAKAALSAGALVSP